MNNMTELFARTDQFPNSAISPVDEMAAYEALWAEKGTTFKRLADKFRQDPSLLPSDLVSREVIEQFKQWLLNEIFPLFHRPPSAWINGAAEYPEKLRAAAHPLELLYFMGHFELTSTPSIAVVGARKVSKEGEQRCKQIVRELVGIDRTVVSGLAAGVDRIAHETCLEYGGRTIGVLGTPLNEAYPKENKSLQDQIAKEHLLISQVPFKRYSLQDYRANRSFFPERNVTLSALTEATIIIEASDTSGTLYQARAAIRQKRKLFILNSCFENTAITWPARYEKLGAIRVHGFEDIANNLDQH